MKQMSLHKILGARAPRFERVLSLSSSLYV